MGEFVNTVDLLGDSVVLDKIIDRTIPQFYDNVITTIRASMFNYCNELEIVNIPNVTKFESQAFDNCTKLKIVDTSALTSMTSISACSELDTFILRSMTMCKTSNSMPLQNSKIASGSGYIYVPRELVDSYKSATGWSKYANQIRALEDYTVDGTISGEFDETKI